MDDIPDASQITKLWESNKLADRSIWTREEVVGVAVDHHGNTIVTGSFGRTREQDYVTLYDMVTVRYDRMGRQLWMALFDGPDGLDDRAVGSAVDGGGNVYVTGASGSASTGVDYATVKYDPSGRLLWANRFNGPLGGDDHPAAIALDSLGNVYVTGSSVGRGDQAEYATVKYDTHGSQVWFDLDDGGSSGNDRARAMAVDSGGNCVVTGESLGSDGSKDYLTIKYSPEGQRVWSARYSTPVRAPDPSVRRDVANAVAADADGNTYVSGSSWGEGGTGDNDIATIKYGPDGDVLWAARFSVLPWTGNEVASKMGLDGQGNTYVAGYSEWGDQQSDYVLLKYGPGGDLAWFVRYDNPETGSGRATDLAVGADGAVIVSGHSTGGYQFGYATIKYDPAGRRKWVAFNQGSLLGGTMPVMAPVGKGGFVVAGVRLIGDVYADVTIMHGPPGIEIQK